MRLDLGTKFDFLQLPILLLFARIFVFFLLLVLQAAVVADLADRRLRGRRDFDQIQSGGSRAGQRLFG